MSDFEPSDYENWVSDQIEAGWDPEHIDVRDYAFACAFQGEGVTHEGGWLAYLNMVDLLPETDWADRRG